MVMYFPLMELSCGRISKISGYHYLYNINTGLNDYQVDRNKQSQVDNKVRNAKKYTCDEDFNNRMKIWWEINTFYPIICNSIIS